MTAPIEMIGAPTCVPMVSRSTIMCWTDGKVSVLVWFVIVDVLLRCDLKAQGGVSRLIQPVVPVLRVVRDAGRLEQVHHHCDVHGSQRSRRAGIEPPAPYACNSCEAVLSFSRS